VFLLAAVVAFAAGAAATATITTDVKMLSYNAQVSMNSACCRPADPTGVHPGNMLLHCCTQICEQPTWTCCLYLVAWLYSL